MGYYKYLNLYCNSMHNYINYLLIPKLNKDLEIESPYNTYRNAGLPPRPICVPGSAAWEGALIPEENDYYYYVARKNGYHYFSKTYKEHVRNIKLARSE